MKRISLNKLKRRKRERVDQITLARIRQLRHEGFGYGRIAKECSVSRATVQMYCRDVKVSVDQARSKADDIHLVLDRLQDLYTLLSTGGADTDDVDFIAKKFREKLSRYDAETLKLLSKNSQAFVSMISKVLTKETTFTQIYRGVESISISNKARMQLETRTHTLSIKPKQKLLPGG